MAEDGGLADCYVRAAYPWRWDRRTWQQYEQHGDEWVTSVEQDLKDRCERYVMGQDAHLGRNNKPEPPQSFWQRLYNWDPYGWK
jgi:hypothetical protein